ncbi:hypothetical protein BJI48_01665 [Helicobacter sp. 11S02596-1]|nr:hypothetical protein BJI48_01665 [Helicobacter sp. 11S02596-1]
MVLGIILSFALPRFSANAKICEIQLSSKLGVLQSRLAMLFTQAQFENKQADIGEIFALLNSLNQAGSAECFLRFDPQSRRILARSHSQSTIFTISPNDFSENPKISCPLEDALCKKISFKTKRK